MIQGLRVLPAYQDARAKGQVIGSKGCEECKRTVSVERRQYNGCGWEPAIAGARPWAPASWLERRLETTVCPGYSTSLPTVLEMTWAYPQWKEGTLTDFLGGQPPTPVALVCLTTLDAGIEEHRADLLRGNR